MTSDEFDFTGVLKVSASRRERYVDDLTGQEPKVEAYGESKLEELEKWPTMTPSNDSPTGSKTKQKIFFQKS